MNPALKLAKTETMYIWNLGTEGVAKIEQIILADVSILSLIPANYQMLRVDLVSWS